LRHPPSCVCALGFGTIKVGIVLWMGEVAHASLCS
jgi:hypothetical protein